MNPLTTLIPQVFRAFAQTIRLLADTVCEASILLAELLPGFGATPRGKQQCDAGADSCAGQQSEDKARSRLVFSIHLKSLLRRIHHRSSLPAEPQYAPAMPEPMTVQYGGVCPLGYLFW
jgi:hypothetical protein